MEDLIKLADGKQSEQRIKKAIKRVQRAGVRATEPTIRAYVLSVGSNSILRASLRDILEVANAF